MTPKYFSCGKNINATEMFFPGPISKIGAKAEAKTYRGKNFIKYNTIGKI